MRVLTVFALSCSACGVVLLWAAFTVSFWQLSSLIAFEDNGDRRLVIDIPVLTLMALLAAAALIAIGRQIAQTLNRPRPADPGPADRVVGR